MYFYRENVGPSGVLVASGALSFRSLFHSVRGHFILVESLFHLLFMPILIKVARLIHSLHLSNVVAKLP